MQYVELVAVCAILQFLSFGALTGQARRLSGLQAPATTGDANFERMYRVQMNTLETLVAFLPVLFIASKYWPAYLIVALGIVFLVGRHFYWRGYVTDPAKRGLGFMLSIVPTFVLLILALIGIGLSVTGYRT